MAKSIAPQWSLRRPSRSKIRQFVASQKNDPFTYADVGCTREFGQRDSDAVPSHYNVDKVRAEVGSGAEHYRAACAAIRNWRMFDVGWVELCWPDASIGPGSSVAIALHLGTAWLVNAARVVYNIDETGDIDRFGFGVGTLPGHAMSGEDRFLVEWDRSDNRVWFSALAVSKPGGITAWASYPAVRQLQKKLRSDAITAMRRSIIEPGQSR